MCRQARARTRKGFLQPGTRSAESKQEASDRPRDSLGDTVEKNLPASPGDKSRWFNPWAGKIP